MATGRTTNARLINGIAVDTIMSAGEWNKLVDGVDRQAYAVGKYLGGDGVLYGGEILLTKKVGPTRALVDGFIGTTAADQSITGLVNNKVNSIWAVRVDPAGDSPIATATFQDGVLSFVAADVAPAHSFQLGTLTLDSGGTATAADNLVLARPTVFPAVTQCWIGTVTVTGLNEGESRWVDVDHSSDIEFRVALALNYTTVNYPPPGGFTITQLENCQSGSFGFLCSNVGAGGDSYYAETTCTAVFSRIGIV